MTSPHTFSVAIVPDVHVPIHDVHALDVVEQILSTQRLDALVQVGDLVDHDQISRFVKDNPAALADGTLTDEWSAARAVLRRLTKSARTKFPRARLFALEGNHEARIHKFESLHPMLRGLFDLPKHLGVTDDSKATWVPADSQGKVLRFVWTANGCVVPRVVSPQDLTPFPEPGLTVLHGWSYGVNGDKITADQSPWPGPVVAGHSHRIQNKTAKRFGLGTSPSAYIIGTMGDLTPDYTRGHPTGWEQGFAIAHLALNAPMVYRVDVIKVLDGRAIGPDGRMYASRIKR